MRKYIAQTFSVAHHKTKWKLIITKNLILVIVNLKTNMNYERGIWNIIYIFKLSPKLASLVPETRHQRTSVCRLPMHIQQPKRSLVNKILYVDIFFAYLGTLYIYNIKNVEAFDFAQL